VCEEVLGSEPACFAPVWVQGRVFDLATDLGIGGARVVAVDANGAARSTVVDSAPDGTYSLPVPAPRDAEGNPLPASVISQTSVILVLESTFVEVMARGQMPPGLRAAPVTAGWSIEGVPPGRYVALAAFENDGLVRDPDTSIGGTMIVHFTVPEGGGTVELGEGFKVTGALEVISPGASALETITTPTPTFVWRDDASEDGYEIRVYDAFGRLVHEDTMVPRVTGRPHVSYVWKGATLEPRMVYQFRAWSWRADARTGRRVLISATEDLHGTFMYAP
jgi:hypothetical protein